MTHGGETNLLLLAAGGGLLRGSGGRGGGGLGLNRLLGIRRLAVALLDLAEMIKTNTTIHQARKNKYERTAQPDIANSSNKQ